METEIWPGAKGASPDLKLAIVPDVGRANCTGLPDPSGAFHKNEPHTISKIPFLPPRGKLFTKWHLTQVANKAIHEYLFSIAF